MKENMPLVGTAGFALAIFVYVSFYLAASGHNAPLIEETQNLASDMLSPRLLVVHDTGRCGKNNESELTGREQLHNPLLHVSQLDVVARADDTNLVEAAMI
jgi:hypothetical protein